MKTTLIIEEILKETPLALQYIPSGLTNHNSIVTLRDRQVVIREPKPENAHLFNYALEQKILDKVRDLDTDLIYYDSKTGIKISEYIPEAEVYQVKYLIRAAKLIKKLHEKRIIIGESFNLMTSFDEFQVKNSIYDLKAYSHILESTMAYNSEMILCHNDLVQGNFLFTDKKDYLIDYEYACDNDPFFDIMSFITENDIQDPEQRNSFYREYFGQLPNEEQQQKLKLFECSHYILWCQWACFMYETHHEPIYKEIADLKYQRLLENT